MPSVTRRRSGGAATAAIGMTPLRTPLRVRRVPATPGTPFAVEDQCCVCLAGISTKRSSTLQPCRHNYHSSCIRHWMETRKSRETQSCPLCRTRCSAITDHTGISAPPAFPYGGTGQPTPAVLREHEQPANLEWLLRETETSLARVDDDLKKARDEQRPVEFIDDIQAEETILRVRRELLQQCLAQVNRGEWQQRPPPAAPMTLQALHERLEQLRQLQQQYLLRMAGGGAAADAQPRFVFRTNNFRQPSVASTGRVVRPPQQQQRQQSQVLQRVQLQQLQHHHRNAMRQAAAPAQNNSTQARSATGNNFRQPTTASTARVVQPPQQRQQSQQLQNHRNSNWTQSRPTTVPVAFAAGRPTVASLARMRTAAARAAPAAPATRAATAVTRRPMTTRIPQPTRYATGAAGPARRRSRLAGQSTAPSPQRGNGAQERRESQSVMDETAHRELAVERAATTRAVHQPVEEHREEQPVAREEETRPARPSARVSGAAQRTAETRRAHVPSIEDEGQPDYRATPRRSERIASRGRLNSVVEVQEQQQQESPLVDLAVFEEGVTARSTPRPLDQ